MVEIEFVFNDDKKCSIQGNLNQKFKEILAKLHSKININENSIKYLYNGKIITNTNRNATINELIKRVDKERNKMDVAIVDVGGEENKSFFINSNEIICPKCKSMAKISINNYQIRIYDCKNKHDINGILLGDYEKEQKIDLAKIICGECLSRNKGNSFNNIFYRCNTCKKNLCLLCKERHDNRHNIINYDDINYICEKHNYPYSLYCKSCKDNICILCEKEHEKHNTISFGKIIPNKEKIKNSLNEFRKKIDTFNKEINEIINKLINVVDNIEIMYKIYNNIIENSNFKNYEMIQNLNNMNVEIYNKEFEEIIQEKYINKKLEKIIRIYDKMTTKNVKESLNFKSRPSNNNRRDEDDELAQIEEYLSGNQLNYH